MAYSDRSLVGVHGWLAFFILTLGVFGPLRSLATIYGQLYANPQVALFYGARWPTIQLLEWTVLAISAGGSIYLAWRLYAVHEASTPRIVIAGLWLLTLVPPLVEMAGVSIIGNLPMQRIAQGLGADMLRPLIYAVIWTAYLLRSQRVANTYTDSAPGELEAVFG